MCALLLVTGFGWVFTRPLRLFDDDAYLHLAIARLFGERGFVALPWARFSALGRHYGDKEWLFHSLLMPFASGHDPQLGGQLALALLCAALAWTLGYLGMRALGRYGALVPLLVLCGSGSFVLRALRLRPELLSIVLLLWVLWALAGQRYVWAAVLAFAFTLSHTAFQSLLGIVLGATCWTFWRQKRASLRPLASVSLGCALALLAHPQFPHNLGIFWLQNVEFFRHHAELDVGQEFQPHTASRLVQLDALWWLGLGLFVLAREPAERVAEAALERARRMATLCWVGALAFSALFMQMGRFATLAVPFITIAGVFELQARGWRIGPRLRLGGSHSLRTALAASLIGALSFVNAAGTAWVNWQLGHCFDASYTAELEALARRLPPAARVAANWDDAESYAFYAPHARFLNLFDPVFMAVPEPQRYAAWISALRGQEPDTPRLIQEQLDSEYLAFSAAGHAALSARLSHDPRARLLQHGRHSLFRLRREHPRFVVGWSHARYRGDHAYVDVTSALDGGACVVVTHQLTQVSLRTRLFELAAWGPSALRVDGEQVVQLTAADEARLGHGPTVPLELTPGSHSLAVRTCRHAGRAGFYLVDRDPTEPQTASDVHARSRR